MDNTKGLIIGTVILTGATTFIRQAKGGTLTFRSYLAASFVGIFLSAIAMANPRLARNFAVLIIFGVLLKDNGGLFKFAAGASGNPVVSPLPHEPQQYGPARATRE